MWVRPPTTDRPAEVVTKSFPKNSSYILHTNDAQIRVLKVVFGFETDLRPITRLSTAASLQGGTTYRTAGPKWRLGGLRPSDYRHEAPHITADANRCTVTP